MSIKTSEVIGKKAPRQRVLSDTEMRALWQAADGPAYPAGPFVRLLLLTGRRLREVAEITWQEVDLEKALWTITPERLPPYSPELNPAENIWQFLRQNHLSNRIFESYTVIVDARCAAWNAIVSEPKRIAQLPYEIGRRSVPNAVG